MLVPSFSRKLSFCSLTICLNGGLRAQGRHRSASETRLSLAAAAGLCLRCAEAGMLRTPRDRGFARRGEGYSCAPVAYPAAAACRRSARIQGNAGHIADRLSSDRRRENWLASLRAATVSAFQEETYTTHSLSLKQSLNGLE